MALIELMRVLRAAFCAVPVCFRPGVVEVAAEVGGAGLRGRVEAAVAVGRPANVGAEGRAAVGAVLRA